MRRFVEPCIEGVKRDSGPGWGEGGVGVRVKGGVGVEGGGGGGIGSGGVEIEKVSRMQPKHENVSATLGCLPFHFPGPVRPPPLIPVLTEGRGVEGASRTTAPPAFFHDQNNAPCCFSPNLSPRCRF